MVAEFCLDLFKGYYFFLLFPFETSYHFFLLPFSFLFGVDIFFLRCEVYNEGDSIGEEGLRKKFLGFHIFTLRKKKKKKKIIFKGNKRHVTKNVKKSLSSMTS